MQDLLKEFHICENRCSHLDSSVIKEYFPDGDFKDAHKDFFNVREDDVQEFYKLQYPFVGRVVFDGKVFTRLVRVVPEFVISIIKTGMPTIITLGELEVYEGNVPITLSHRHLTPASEIIVECANLFNSIGLDNQNRSEAKINRLNRKLKFLEIGKSHYDLLGIMQSIYTSIVLAANGANMLKTGIGHLHFHANYKKRDLLHSLIGPILNPLKVVNSLPADTPMEEIQLKILEDIRKDGQLELTSPTDVASISAPDLEDSPEYLFRLEGEYWEIGFDGTTIRLKDSKGLQYINTLLKNPHRSIRADSLTAPYINAKSGKREDISGQVAEKKPPTYNNTSDKTYIAMTNKIIELEQILEELIPGSDEYFLAEDHLKKQRKERSRYFNRTGQERPVDSGEKARQSVSTAISNAKKKINKDIPELIIHLTNYLHTGFECIYDPPPDNLKSWHF